MKINKKGISPLIATVLIIGFVIVLGAVFFKWGGDLMRSSTEESQKKLDLDSACNQLTGLNLEYRLMGSEPTLLIDNKNERKIIELTIRGYGIAGEGLGTAGPDGTNVGADGTSIFIDLTGCDAITDGVAPFEVFPCVLLDAQGSTLDIAKVGIIPWVDVDGDDTADGACSQEVTVAVA
ncbi:MAG TPA: archaellin/type IV pilin N-terminal domain-containing protein [Candidatus Nanoarchaeia archaeon]|nr:archaellin/type IV pilin N-terminal domain-containing protein [Candidatus Nanoarchaeia archaeon]